jgi:hypothetical protein
MSIGHTIFTQKIFSILKLYCIFVYNNTENNKRNRNLLIYRHTLRGGEVVSRLAHNQEVVGSNPTPATKIKIKNEHSYEHSVLL